MADLTNDSAETLGFAEAISKNYTQPISELLDLHGFCPATPAYFVGSDLAIFNGVFDAATAMEFIKNRSPIGYAPFKDFVAGEYLFRKAYVDFVFEPADGADAQLSLTEATIIADVPDRRETNTATITVAASGVAVTFANAFTAAPRVVVTPIGSTALIPVLTAAPTTTGFTVKLYDNNGTAVTGTVIWTAQGY